MLVMYAAQISTTQLSLLAEGRQWKITRSQGSKKVTRATVRRFFRGPVGSRTVVQEAKEVCLLNG